MRRKPAPREDGPRAGRGPARPAPRETQRGAPARPGRVRRAGLGGLFILAPLAWMLSTPLKTRSEVFRFPPEWIPEAFLWHNYVKALTLLPFDVFFRNTILITGLAVLGELALSPSPACAGNTATPCSWWCWPP